MEKSISLKGILLCLLTFLIKCTICQLSLEDSVELYRYVQHKFSPTGLIVNHLAIDDKLGYVYIGAQNRLYQLDKTLTSVIANVSTALTPQDLCSYNNQQLCEETLINNTNKLLLIDSSSDRLIVCGTVFRGTCKTRSLQNISKILNETSKIPSQLSEADYVACNKKDCSTVGLITQGPTVNNDVLYVAKTITDGDDIWRHENSISTHSLNVDPSRENVLFGYAVDVAHNKAKSSVLVVSQNRRDFRNYKYMFETGGDDGFVYFLFSRTGKDNNFRSIVARICKSDPIFNSYVELPVYCVNNYSMNFILGAHYSPHDPNNINSNGTLYILFNTTTGSAVCSFERAYLDSLFYETMEICYKEMGLNKTGVERQVVNVIGVSSNECDNSGQAYLRESDSLDSMVSNSEKLTLSYYEGYYEASANQIYCGAYYLPVKMTRLSYTQAHVLYQGPGVFTSVTTNKIQDIVVAFVGTQSGLILKVNLNSGELYGTIPVGQPLLTDMIWNEQTDLAMPQLYITAANEVLLIKVAACSKYTSCDTCILSNDPYCGWCILESRCSTKNECKTADRDRTRWMGQKTKQCIYANSPAPRERTLNADIVTMVYGLPVLATGEQYQCVFGANHTKPATTRLSGSFTEVSCKAPSSADIPLNLPGQDYVNVSLSVRYNKSIDVVSTTATFYDCHLYGQSLQKDMACAGCLSSRWQCRWCISDHTCLPQEQQESSLCETDLSVCPTILSVETPDTLLSVGQENSITLLAKNLPEHGTYRCMIHIEYEQESVTVQARLIESGRKIVCSPHSYNYASEMPTAVAEVTVYWKLDFIVDYAQLTPITFYKCSVGHSDCSLCVTANPQYKCGWCVNSQQCSIQQSCPTKWITSGDQCDPPQITGFSPLSGPLLGGTEINISGINMGTKPSDVYGVTVAGKPCTVLNDLYDTSVRIVCITDSTTVKGDKNKVDGKVIVNVRNHSISSAEDFVYRNPIISGLSGETRMGPQAGGTLIEVRGNHLDTGSTLFINIGIDNLPCEVQSVRPDVIKCVTSNSTVPRNNQDVALRFDNFSYDIYNTFNYTRNPKVKDYYTLSGSQLTSFLAGGRNISFTGTMFTSVKTPYLIATLHPLPTPPLLRRRRRSVLARMRVSTGWRRKRNLNKYLPAFTSTDYVSPCHVVNSTVMTCPSPMISPDQGRNSSHNISNSLFVPASLKLEMDALTIDLKSPDTLKYYPNPQVLPLKKDQDLQWRKNELLTIRVLNLNKNAITKEEVIVMVGALQCLVRSIDENILCPLPDGVEGDTYDVTVTIGNNKWNIGEVTYYLDPPPLSTTTMVIICVLCAALVIVIALVIFYLCRKSKAYKENKNDFQQAMEAMEMSVRADFRKAFAELSIDMSDLTSDVGDYGIPCLDYRTFVTNLFFPSYRYHPCMKAPETSHRPAGSLEQGLGQFLLLLSNRNFLSVFIHTLEEQKSFSNRDKGNVASLLTVALHQKLDYFTEITKSLISDLISVSVQRNPKLILRRSDSVAERMLNNWMYICLYPYLREKAGSPIFLLLKAIKQQVSKGPLDAITGKARYTLNDDRLLKEDVEHETLTLFVAPTNQSDDEPVIVKVLSCDSVAQVKEKVMDAVYKRVPFSQRPRVDQLDIEWRHGRSGHLVLPNMDYTAEPGSSRWRRLMTITDYKVANNATLALIRKQQEQDGINMSEISNHSADTSALSPMLPEENQMKIYHLVKFSDDIEGKRESTINRDRHKHIADLYLLRLINMKGILQNYVDGVIQSILDKTSIPCPVKHFFHFLDEIAAKHDIVDPEVLHLWKTNSLLGRFWVTILKSPESVFDIEKPDTIASSMAVISQTFIDACNISEHKPTKDSPINKQLYAKEIPNYKRMVAEYYKIIKEQPSVSDQDVNAYIAEINRKHGCEFDVNVALKELWGYVNKFYEEINESLENDANISSTVIQKLQQTYSLIDTVGNGI